MVIKLVVIIVITLVYHSGDFLFDIFKLCSVISLTIRLLANS